MLSCKNVPCQHCAHCPRWWSGHQWSLYTTYTIDNPDLVQPVQLLSAVPLCYAAIRHGGDVWCLSINYLWCLSTLYIHIWKPILLLAVRENCFQIADFYAALLSICAFVQELSVISLLIPTLQITKLCWNGEYEESTYCQTSPPGLTALSLAFSPLLLGRIKHLICRVQNKTKVLRAVGLNLKIWIVLMLVQTAHFTCKLLLTRATCRVCVSSVDRLPLRRN